MTFTTATVFSVTDSGSRMRPRARVKFRDVEGLAVSAVRLRNNVSIGTSIIAATMPMTIEVVSAYSRHWLRMV